MNLKTLSKAFAVGPACLLLLGGCAHWGRGTAGADDYQTATASGSGEPYTIGNRDPFQHTGMPDATIAASRAEASRDVSGSGSAELARRSAAATERDSARVAQPGTEDQLPNSDASLSERVRMALSSPATTPGVSAGAPPLSIQQLNNLSVTATGQVVTLRGTVRSEDEKREIGSRVEAVPGVKQVRNDLEVQR